MPTAGRMGRACHPSTGAKRFATARRARQGKRLSFFGQSPGEGWKKSEGAFMNDALSPAKHMTGSARGAVKGWSAPACA